MTWPAIDSAVSRDLARGKLWLAGALILGGVALGGLATLIRLVQDGFAGLAARQALSAAVAGPTRAPRAEVQPKDKPRAEIAPARSGPTDAMKRMLAKTIIQTTIGRSV